MDIKIKPMPGCLNVTLAIFTLGVAPLGQWITQRSWPKTVDESGLLTRGGTHIAWAEFTKIERVLTRITQGSSATVERYDLYSPKGKVVIAAYRLENGDAVLDYVWQHLPQSAKHGS